MNWRLASRLSVITMAVLVILLVALIQQRQSAATATITDNTSNTSGLQGTDLNKTPASNFSLTDQVGKQVALSQFKGEPVIVTFMYTHCPDVCPLTAEKLHTTLQGLGNRPAILAVSIDPQRDNQAAALAFSKAHNMQDSWHYLVGSQKELAPIWSAYNIFTSQGTQQTINHSMGLYLIDKQGRERVFLDPDFTPVQLTADLQTLLKE